MMKRTLLIIAHGSRSARWNQTIVNFCSELHNLQHETPSFDEITWCFLEHTQPSIQEAIIALCKNERKEIIALPLFLSVGQHVENDIPEEFEKIAQKISVETYGIRYQYNHVPILLLDPLPPFELLTDNARKRFTKHSTNTARRSLILVYYGSKKFGNRWDTLAHAVEGELKKQLPDVRLQHAYAGDAVDFSPDPLASRITEEAANSDEIVILPELVAVGVLQEKIIPAAIHTSKSESKIIFPQDSILPDKNLEKRIFQYAYQSITPSSTEK